jgi:hypothetical protein
MFDVVSIGVHEEFKFSCSPKGNIYTSKDVFKKMKKCWPLCDLFFMLEKKFGLYCKNVCMKKIFKNQL